MNVAGDIGIDDMVFDKVQAAYLLAYLKKGPRSKRKIINFSTFPTQKWTFPIKYVIDTAFTRK
jgi:hypothetical protein